MLIFHAKSLPSALAGIGKSAGRAFTEAFFAELFNPFTQQLAAWGKSVGGFHDQGVGNPVRYRKLPSESVFTPMDPESDY